MTAFTYVERPYRIPIGPVYLTPPGAAAARPMQTTLLGDNHIRRLVPFGIPASYVRPRAPQVYFRPTGMGQVPGAFAVAMTLASVPQRKITDRAEAERVLALVKGFVKTKADQARKALENARRIMGDMVRFNSLNDIGLRAVSASLDDAANRATEIIGAAKYLLNTAQIVDKPQADAVIELQAGIRGEIADISVQARNAVTKRDTDIGGKAVLAIAGSAAAMARTTGLADALRIAAELAAAAAKAAAELGKKAYQAVTTAVDIAPYVVVGGLAVGGYLLYRALTR